MDFEYITPEFLENSSTDEIHNRMLKELPDSWDKSTLSIPYDLTRPTAIEHARLKQFTMNEAIKLIWPMFATGIYLDYHGKSRVTRKSAVAATGKLLVYGKEGGIINKGDLFSTQVLNDEVAVIFSSNGTYEIPDTGEIEIDITCTEAGKNGNVPANTIILKFSQNANITSVNNPEATTGGYDEEDDDTYRERLVEYDRSLGNSYVGNPADYKRWANEVAGVGTPEVIPANDDTGLVTIILTDSNGDPANEALCEAVYNHIMSQDDEEERLAPINAYLKVIPPATSHIAISAVVELADGNLTDAKAEILKNLKIYLAQALGDGEIRYTKVLEVFSKSESLYDFKNVTVNGGTANIQLSTSVLLLLEAEDITLTEGIV